MKARKLILSIFACGAVALTFSTTTYAWFRIGSSGYVSNLDFKVISGLGFKIAADGSDSSYYTDTLDSRMMKAAIASFEALTPVFSALPPLMAAPA